MFKKLVAGARTQKFSFSMVCVEFRSVELFRGIVLSRGGVFFKLFTLGWLDFWLGYSFSGGTVLICLLDKASCLCICLHHPFHQNILPPPRTTVTHCFYNNEPILDPQPTTFQTFRRLLVLGRILVVVNAEVCDNCDVAKLLMKWVI